MPRWSIMPRYCTSSPTSRPRTIVGTVTEENPYELAARAAEKLAELTGVESHDVALVLGSGWLPAVDALGEVVAEVATTDLPGFAAPAVVGHAGRIRSV